MDLKIKMKITKKKLSQIIKEEIRSLAEREVIDIETSLGEPRHENVNFEAFVLFSSPRCGACAELKREMDERYPGHNIKTVDPTKHAFTGWSRIRGKPDEYENMIVVPTLVSKKGLMYKFEAGKKQGILDYLERYVNSI